MKTENQKLSVSEIDEDTVQRMSLVPAASRPARITLRASSAICSTSSSVSVGSPHMK